MSDNSSALQASWKHVTAPYQNRKVVAKPAFTLPAPTLSMPSSPSEPAVQENIIDPNLPYEHALWVTVVGIDPIYTHLVCRALLEFGPIKALAIPNNGNFFHVQLTTAAVAQHIVHIAKSKFFLIGDEIRLLSIIPCTDLEFATTHRRGIGKDESAFVYAEPLTRPFRVTWHYYARKVCCFVIFLLWTLLIHFFSFAKIASAYVIKKIPTDRIPPISIASAKHAAHRLAPYAIRVVKVGIATCQSSFSVEKLKYLAFSLKNKLQGVTHVAFSSERLCQSGQIMACKLKNGTCAVKTSVPRITYIASNALFTGYARLRTACMVGIVSTRRIFTQFGDNVYGRLACAPGVLLARVRDFFAYSKNKAAYLIYLCSAVVLSLQKLYGKLAVLDFFASRFFKVKRATTMHASSLCRAAFNVLSLPASAFLRAYGASVNFMRKIRAKAAKVFSTGANRVRSSSASGIAKLSSIPEYFVGTAKDAITMSSSACKSTVSLILFQAKCFLTGVRSQVSNGCDHVKSVVLKFLQCVQSHCQYLRGLMPGAR